jgi:hypothetical protein
MTEEEYFNAVEIGNDSESYDLLDEEEVWEWD